MQQINFNKTFTVEKKLSGWNYEVGRFTDKLNAIANSFLMSGKTTYPDGTKIAKFAPGRVAMDLGRYCRANGCKTSQDRISALEELYDLCSKSQIGFTKFYWWTMGYGKQK